MGQVPAEEVFKPIHDALISLRKDIEAVVLAVDTARELCEVVEDRIELLRLANHCVEKEIKTG